MADCKNCMHCEVCEVLEKYRDPLHWQAKNGEFCCSYFNVADAQRQEVAKEIFEEHNRLLGDMIAQVQHARRINIRAESWMRVELLGNIESMLKEVDNKFREYEKKYTEGE